MHKNILFALFFCLGSCSNRSDTPTHKAWQAIAAHNEANSLHRPLIYRAMVPVNWERIDTDPALSLNDTMKAICEFSIHEEDSKIRVTIHTFPINDSTPRIPPIAQINRWKEQFDELNPLSVSIDTDSHGGYTGFCLKADGIYRNVETTMLGWSMQLVPEYERKLGLQRNPLDQYKLADFTIKAIGKSDIVEKHKPDIIRFAQSFELIDELPPPL